MLHHVLPATRLAFAPNRHLEVTPEFLDRVIRLVIARGFDIISLMMRAPDCARVSWTTPLSASLR